MIADRWAWACTICALLGFERIAAWFAVVAFAVLAIDAWRAWPRHERAD